MQIDGEHNTWFWNLDQTINWVVSYGITRLLDEGSHAWTEGERADLVRLRDGFRSGEPDGESWRLLEKMHSRLWD